MSPASGAANGQFAESFDKKYTSVADVSSPLFTGRERKTSLEISLITTTRSEPVYTRN